MRIAFDIGGTFTDVLALSDDRRLATAKVLSLIDQVSDDIVACLEQLNPGGRVDRFVHGTTIATNAVLERKFPSGALVATAGFEDVLEIARHARREVYSVRPASSSRAAFATCCRCATSAARRRRT